jgi:hypothetical protein
MDPEHLQGAKRGLSSSLSSHRQILHTSSSFSSSLKASAFNFLPSPGIFFLFFLPFETFLPVYRLITSELFIPKSIALLVWPS